MPFHQLSTTKVAKAAGCHPNTVRLYEQIGFIAPVPRSPKGYRLYSQAHLDQMCLARHALAGAWPGPNIRRSLIALVKLTAAQDYPVALAWAYQHLEVVRGELAQAEEAVAFLERWVRGDLDFGDSPPMQIGETAHLLSITVDMLRNWERNGLVTVPRSPANRYRQYRAPEIGRVRVIRLLRQTGYSPMAILRVLTQLDQDAQADLRAALDTPRPGEEVYCTADRWLTTLAEHEQRAHELIEMALQMVKKYSKENQTVR